MNFHRKSNSNKGDTSVIRHAKAPSAISTSGHGKSRGLFGLACLCVLGLAAFLGSGPPSAGAAESFPGQGFLPDNRAWEMVSPPEKNGGQLTTGTGSIRASSTGDAVVFDSQIAFGDAMGTGSLAAVVYRSDRGSEAWSTHGLMPPQLVEPSSQFIGADFPRFTPDLSHAVLRASDAPLVPGAPAHVSNLYLTDGHGGSPQLITSSENPLLPNPLSAPGAVLIDGDGTHVFFQNRTNSLTADAPPQEGFCTEFGICNLRWYQWGEGILHYAGFLPDGTATTEMAAGNGNSSGGVFDSALSQDGTRLYFGSPEGAAAKLYVRRNGTTTAWVSESEASSPDAEPRASFFWGESSTGSTTFFTSAEQLLDADLNPTTDQFPGNPFGEGSPGVDLYMYTDGPDPEGEPNLTLISRDEEPADGVDPEVAGVLGGSEDGSRVYFAATGQIVENGPTGGQPKLYVWDQGTVHYIATLQYDITGSDTGNWSLDPRGRASRVTPDGRYLLFRSAASQPGGYDNAEHSEFFRYDAVAARTVCISCAPSGAPASSDAGVGYPGGGLVPEYFYLSRALSADGSRAFFSSADALVPEDTNGKFDAYEWEEDGHGSCHVAPGCISLLSSGEDDLDSYFADASEDGKDAYVITQEPLSRWDRGDSDMDLYDARAGGGVPEPAIPPVRCEGDACQPPPLNVNDATPASAGTLGPGNPKATRKRKAKKGHKKRRHSAKKHHTKHIATPKNG